MATASSVLRAVVVVALCGTSACSKKKPVACADVDASTGATPGILTFDKATTTVELGACSDGVRRRIWCRQATSGGYKCECTATKKDGTYSTIEFRTEDELAASNAKVFARHCEWTLQ